MAQEEQQMQQLFPEEFEDVPPSKRESTILDRQEDSHESTIKNETTSPSTKGTPKATPIQCPMSDNGVRVINNGDEDETTTTLPEGTPNLPTRILHGMIQQFHE
jgi:hypothetical protein